MRRLTIHLNKVEKTAGKSYNTLAHIVKTEKQSNDLIAKHGDNVKKYYFSNLN